MPYAQKFFTGGTTRLFKPYLGEPVAKNGGKLKNVSAFLIPKSDTKAIADAKEAIDKAIKAGIDNVWGGSRPANLNNPLKDGDLKGYDYMAGCYLIDASTMRKPRLYHLDGSEASASEFRSGAIVQAELSIFPFQNGVKKGLSAGIERIWLVTPSNYLQDDDNNVAPIQAERNKADSTESDWFFLN